MSVAQELRKPASERHYQAEAIGIVVPLYEFDLPRPVEEFIMGSTFDTDYLHLVRITTGARAPQKSRLIVENGVRNGIL